MSGGLAVQEVNGRAAFMALAGEWDALVERGGRDELFYRHRFLRIWLDNFAPRARLRLLVARDGGGRLCAALPLLEERALQYGVPVRRLASATNAHSCRFDMLAEDGEAAARAFLAYLQADPGWDVLRLADVPEGGQAWHVPRVAREAGLPCGAWVGQRSPYVVLPETREELAGRLHAKLKANLRRRKRRLEEQGRLAVECVAGGTELESHLEQGLALERSGWKGRRGTAISQQAATRGFYTELAREAAVRDELALYFLSVGGRPVAFQYGLTYAGRYLLLKPAYDETFKECSPGQLLVDEVLGDCIARGLTEMDFLGPDMTWKRDWTERVRVHTWLHVFRDTALGRALCAAKFRWVPAVKEVAARWRRQ